PSLEPAGDGAGGAPPKGAAGPGPYRLSGRHVVSGAEGHVGDSVAGDRVRVGGQRAGGRAHPAVSTFPLLIGDSPAGGAATTPTAGAASAGRTAPPGAGPLVASGSSRAGGSSDGGGGAAGSEGCGGAAGFGAG